MSTYNNQFYHIGPASQLAEWQTKGFDNIKTSANGKWLLGGKGGRDMEPWIDLDTNDLDQYLVDLGVTSCCLDHQTARAIHTTRSTTVNGDDGFVYLEAE